MNEPVDKANGAARADDVLALQQAFEQFTKSTATLEAAYQQLQARVDSLDRELEQKNRQLAFTTDYLNSVLDSMSDGVVAIDTEGRITTFNRAAEAILGYTAGSIVGAAYADVFGRPFGDSERLTAVDMKTQSGAFIPVTERISPVADKDGRQIGRVKVFQDLSEIEYLREQIRRKDRLAAIGEMAATVAHEIRNPLGGIRGFAALLERDLTDNEDAQRLVQKILAGTRNLDRVVNELLEYTRPIELRKARCDLAELVESAAGLAGISGKCLQIESDLPAGAIAADADRLRQVFLNILLNAWQSTGPDGTIQVAINENGEDAVVTVADNGPGINAEDLDRIFFPFFTTKEKGTGLGLAVAAKIVETHGGVITAQSTRGSGATFVVRLPRKGDVV